MTTADGQSETYELEGVILVHRNPAHITCVVRGTRDEYYHFNDSSRRVLKKKLLLEVFFLSFESDQSYVPYSMFRG